MGVSETGIRNYAENFETGCGLRCFREEEAYLYFNGAPIPTAFDCDSVMVVSTEDLHFALPDLKIFPNPFDQTISISGLNISRAAYQLTITDILGKTILQQNVVRQEMLELKVSHLPPGVYLLSLFLSPTTQISRKVIKIE